MPKKNNPVGKCTCGHSLPELEVASTPTAMKATTVVMICPQCQQRWEIGFGESKPAPPSVPPKISVHRTEKRRTT